MRRGGIEGEEGVRAPWLVNGRRAQSRLGAPGIRVRGPRARCSVSVQVQPHDLRVPSDRLPTRPARI